MEAVHALPLGFHRGYKHLYLMLLSSLTGLYLMLTSGPSYRPTLVSLFTTAYKIPDTTLRTRDYASDITASYGHTSQRNSNTSLSPHTTATSEKALHPHQKQTATPTKNHGRPTKQYHHNNHRNQHPPLLRPPAPHQPPPPLPLTRLRPPPRRPLHRLGRSNDAPGHGAKLVATPR